MDIGHANQGVHAAASLVLSCPKHHAYPGHVVCEAGAGPQAHTTTPGPSPSSVHTRSLGGKQARKANTRHMLTGREGTALVGQRSSFLDIISILWSWQVPSRGCTPGSKVKGTAAGSLVSARHCQGLGGAHNGSSCSGHRPALAADKVQCAARHACRHACVWPLLQHQNQKVTPKRERHTMKWADHSPLVRNKHEWVAGLLGRTTC